MEKTIRSLFEWWFFSWTNKNTKMFTIFIFQYSIFFQSITLRVLRMSIFITFWPRLLHESRYPWPIFSSFSWLTQEFLWDSFLGLWRTFFFYELIKDDNEVTIKGISLFSYSFEAYMQQHKYSNQQDIWKAPLKA